MRKSGPLRNIRLCACTAVGAGPGVATAVAAEDDVPKEAIETAGRPRGGGADSKRQNTNINRRLATAIRTARRARIHSHSMGSGGFAENRHRPWNPLPGRRLA